MPKGHLIIAAGAMDSTSHNADYRSATELKIATAKASPADAENDIKAAVGTSGWF
jgi:hypothetical protein